MQKPGNSRPESSVDLRGAQLQWANDLSSKKNVFKVRRIQISETEMRFNETYTKGECLKLRYAQICQTLKDAIKYQQVSFYFSKGASVTKQT